MGWVIDAQGFQRPKKAALLFPKRAAGNAAIGFLDSVITSSNSGTSIAEAPALSPGSVVSLPVFPAIFNIRVDNVSSGTSLIKSR